MVEWRGGWWNGGVAGLDGGMEGWIYSGMEGWLDLGIER